jgi:AraC family transcriptional regulator of arabinose operon
MNYIGFTEENPTLHIENPQEIIDTFQELFVAWKKKQDYYLLFSAFFKLVYLLRKNNRLANNLSVLNTDNNIFQKAEQYLQQNIHKNIKVTDLVTALHIDRSYFTKIFTKRFHETPHQYIFRLRMRNAELFLVSTDYSIKKIAELLNFSDVYSFSKQFKKIYHLAPSKYRKLYNNQS